MSFKRITWDSFETIAEAMDMECLVYPMSELNTDAWAYNPPDGKHTRTYWATLTPDERKERLKNHGMRGKTHSAETRKKMSESTLGTKRPTLYRGGTLQKDGIIVSFECLRHFCIEHKLSSGHICELLKGKRKSVKGWTNAL